VTGRKRPIHRLSDLLPGIASRLGLEQELRAARAISSWSRIVEELAPAAAGGSELLEVRPPALIVSASDAAVGQELRLHSTELLDSFAVAPGGQRLRELHVIVRGAKSGGRARPR
jgi:hypothetical protein